MLTPQEVADKTFKQAFVGGYDMPAVDEFLEQLTEDYTNLYKENAVLKNKMKVLVEKLEEYRGNEDSIRQAYLAIRSQAEKELEDARVESGRILEEAREQAKEYSGNLEELVAREEKRLAVTREQTVAFVNILKECYGRQMEQLDIILTASMEDSPKKKHDDAVRATAEEINASLTAAMDSAVGILPESSQEKSSLERSGLERSGSDVFGLEETEEPTVIMSTAVETFPAEPEIAAAEPVASEVQSEQDAQPAPVDEDLVYSIQQSLTATWNEDVDWTPEEISEVRRPTFDFSSLPGNFGHKKSEGKRGKK